MKFIWKAISTFLGVGYIPLAPGTAASLLFALFYKFFLVHLTWPLYLLFLLLLFSLGVISASQFARELGQNDPRQIVVDEVCGQLVACFAIPQDWLTICLSFLLFRFFDIVKPFPIRKIERLPLGWGIMADDIVAAIYSSLILHFYLLLK